MKFGGDNVVWFKASISGKKTETNIFDLVLSIDKTIFTLIVSDTHWLNYYIIWALFYRIPVHVCLHF